ncbi:Glycosyltransferase [Acidisarcina polymorpha]|uniref:Glycosyltransferase n=2 Tax=Acidisarcina polymorpha TaxID=2211140 RepID=A0A2Z5G6F8_9BACT|nr:Glycosyltransferase [Acidisarcina polymorpha]
MVDRPETSDEWHMPAEPIRQERGHPPPKLAIVLPCYNEEEVLPETSRRLLLLLDDLSESGLIEEGSLYFVDDGSEDGTWQFIQSLAASNERVHGIKLSRNYGHQRALLAGLLHAPGDVVISIDADLQDDLTATKSMLSGYASGAEIVYGVRRLRQMDTSVKRVTAEAYYSILRAIGVNLIFNHADYRLLSRPVIEALREYKETNIFLRGLIPQLGFQSALVYYDRQERFAGVSKYPFSKMLALAIEGITSFSDVPLKIITILGLVISLVSFAMATWALWIRIFNPSAVPGWASTVIPLYMLGGIQLLCMGVIGQYLAKIYSETKSRPRFIIEKLI